MAQIRTGTVYFGKNDDDIVKYISEDVRDKFSSYVRRLIRKDMEEYYKNQGMPMEHYNNKHVMEKMTQTEVLIPEIPNTVDIKSDREMVDPAIAAKSELDASIKSIAVAAIQDYLAKSDILNSIITMNNANAGQKKSLDEMSSTSNNNNDKGLDGNNLRIMEEVESFTIEEQTNEDLVEVSEEKEKADDTYTNIEYSTQEESLKMGKDSEECTYDTKTEPDSTELDRKASSKLLSDITNLIGDQLK